MRRGVMLVFGLVLAAGLAWWAGSATGDLLGSEDKEGHFQRQKAMTEAFEQKNDAIKIGNRWPDILLQNLEGDWIATSSIIHDTTLIVFFEPGCEACEVELDALGEFLTGEEKLPRVVLLSDGHPLDIAQIKKARGIRSPILIDRGRELSLKMEGMIYPMNFMISPDLTIVSIVAGRLTRDEIRELLQ